MKVYTNPSAEEIQKIIARPVNEKLKLDQLVQEIFDEVAKKGDAALKKFTKKFDKVDITTLQVSQSEIDAAEKKCSKELINAIDVAYNNIYKFHFSQKEEVKIVETIKGVSCWRESKAIERVGLYIPGGTAPLFSTVLMLGIPAQIAGCKELILCSPPDKNGEIHPAILLAAKKSGIKTILKVGGIQAIAAMSVGTESIQAVYKIFGPGNSYVTAAKQYAQQNGVAIDMPAGPSEVMIFADKTADPDFVAADLLSQAEHGIDSQTILICLSKAFAEAVQSAIREQLVDLPRKEMAEKSLENSRIIVLDKDKDVIPIINAYAPEHLIIAVEDEGKYLDDIYNAGSVFLGNYTPESAGDYASGTNHTLPTNGYARAYSGVSLDSFVKKITYQRISPKGLQSLGHTIEVMAEAENLLAHKNAVSIRLKKLENK